MKGLRVLAVVAAALAFIVIVVGAYVRLSDAGLGCPDWPFCYGKPVPAPMADTAAHGKAWKEMGHRYLAGTLGMLIAALFFLSLKFKRNRGLTTAVVALVVFQATLGMWTVTMLLRPAIVTSHLLGGMAILALLLWLALSQFEFKVEPQSRSIRLYAAAALGILAVQIALGGWVSANYAALACPDLPGCLGQAVPEMNFADAFHVLRELGRTGDGELLPLDALVAIHWTHRVFAIVAFCAILLSAWKAFFTEGLRRLAVLLACLLVLQVSLGVANVAFGLPLPLAAAHNAGAALLLGALVVLNFFVSRGLRPAR
jgi:cytochrome c oxidase assembly protein subunit 15